jgi:hypothetical protein
MAESGNRLVMRTEKVTVASSGVSQVLTSAHDLTYSVSIYSDDANSAVFYIGNDGNDTVASTTGRPLGPGGTLDINSTNFFSPHTEYVSMAKIFINGTGSDTYRLLYWVSA